MHRYFIEIAYNGKNYHGWQVQPNAVTIQEILMEKLSLMLREEVYVIGSGRTDTGVHCKQQFAHFDLSQEIDTSQIKVKLNSFLPNDISISAIRKVKEDAHARFDATFRRYEYHITLRKDPFLTDFTWQVYNELDFELMNEAAQVLKQIEYFESFCKTKTQNEHFMCDVTAAFWEKPDANSAIFHIKANRFLRGMVRLIVGDLVRVGTGKKSIEQFKKDAEARTFRSKRVSAPAQGLYLCEVGYPENIFV